MAEITLILFSLAQLQAAFDQAERETAARFKSQTCSMKNCEGADECPICYFRGRVKAYLSLGEPFIKASLPEGSNHVDLDAR